MKRMFFGLLATLCACSAFALESSYGPFVPGEKVQIDTGLAGYTAKGLPSGLRLNKKTGDITGAAKKPTADGGVAVTFTKKGAEPLTAQFSVGPVPRVNVTLAGDANKCKVTGGNKAYLAGKKVSLVAKAPKGTAFTGWYADGAPWPDEASFLTAKQKLVMPPQDLDLTATFKAESVSVDCGAVLEIKAKESVSIPVVVDCESGLKTITAKKLPTGLKYNKKSGCIEGAAKKTGAYTFSLTVTTKAGSKVTKAFELAVLTEKPEPQPVPEPAPINDGPSDMGGVQLWEDGPYWAECNVGASKPEESGYYFWWGDTVGYRPEGVRKDDYYHVTWVSSRGVRMSDSPFDYSTCPIAGYGFSEFELGGYIDSTGNLVAEHDAATAHLGAPWRMPTEAEFDALISNCTSIWTTRNGVYGRLVTGTGAYSMKQVFFPAAGLGYCSYLFYLGSGGEYLSSTQDFSNWGYVWHLYISSGKFDLYHYDSIYGQSVRPVRDSVE